MKENYLAVALTKRDVGEADRLYTFYTKEEGMLFVGAKGVRKMGAKLAAHTEDYMLTRIVIAKNFGPGTLAGAYSEKSSIQIRGDYDALCTLERIRGIFIRLMRSQQQDKYVFDLLVDLIDAIEQSVKQTSSKTKDLSEESYRPQEYLGSAFLLKLYESMGYRFPLDECAVCEKSLEPEKNFFSAYDGGVLCSGCARNMPHSLPLDVDTLKAMRLINTHDFSQAQKVIITKRIASQLQLITDHIATWVLR